MKAQVAMEFGLYVVIAILLMTIVSAYIINNEVQNREEREVAQLEDIARSLQQEFFLAATVNPGFSREIVLPEKINRKEYTISIANTSIYFKQGELESIQTIPEIRGSTTAKTFTIKTDTSGVFIE